MTDFRDAAIVIGSAILMGTVAYRASGSPLLAVIFGGFGIVLAVAVVDGE